MKTVKWLVSALPFLAALSVAAASLSVSLEGDARLQSSDAGGTEAGINSIGGAFRQVFADRHGDRVIVYVQGELADDLSEVQLHQAYVEWKGPMGRWNAAVGRVPLPWGLLTTWSPDRMPFGSPYDWTKSLDSDNGVLLRGTLGMWDYGLALTQGYGMESIEKFPGPGNLTGRIGVTLGTEENLSLGLSLATGTVYPSGHGNATDHMMPENGEAADDEEAEGDADMEDGEPQEEGEAGDAAEWEKRTALALDCTWYAGRGVYRFEAGARRTEGQWHGTLFAAADYALFPKLTLQAAGQVYEHEKSHVWGRAYGGFSIPLPWFTIRGGYEYERAEVEDHRVVVQVYRLYRFVR